MHDGLKMPQCREQFLEVLATLKSPLRDQRSSEPVKLPNQTLFAIQLPCGGSGAVVPVIQNREPSPAKPVKE